MTGCCSIARRASPRRATRWMRAADLIVVPVIPPHHLERAYAEGRSASRQAPWAARPRCCRSIRWSIVGASSMRGAGRASRPGRWSRWPAWSRRWRRARAGRQLCRQVARRAGLCPALGRRSNGAWPNPDEGQAARQGGCVPAARSAARARRLCGRRVPMADSRDAGSVYWVEPNRAGRPAAETTSISPARCAGRSSRTASASPPMPRSISVWRSAPKWRTIAPTPGSIRRSSAPRSSCTGSASRIRSRLWDGDVLTGGLYGIALGPGVLRRIDGQPRARFVEGRARLAGRAAQGGRLSRCSTAQFMTGAYSPRSGCVEISRRAYLALLATARLEGVVGGGRATAGRRGVGRDFFVESTAPAGHPHRPRHLARRDRSGATLGRRSSRSS